MFSSLILAGLMIACAGTVRLPMMWIYLGVYWGLGFPAALIAGVSLDAERRQPGPGGIDPISRPAASFLFLATIAVALLDVGRFHWSGAILQPIQFTALFVFLLAGAVQSWAIAANPFFSTAIRARASGDDERTVPLRPSPRLPGTGNQHAGDGSGSGLAPGSHSGAELLSGHALAYEPGRHFSRRRT
jgi:hypothetical protein